MFKTIIFDLDGTLTDSGDGIMNCGKIALKAMGRPEPEREKLLQMRGPSLMWSFTTLFGLTRDEALKAIEIYRANYVEHGIPLGSVFDGAIDMLDALRNAGLKVYIATAKYELHARMATDRFDLTRHVDGVFGSGDPRSGATKADIIKRIMEHEGGVAPAVMIGDKAIDVEAGKNAGVATIAVTYGYAGEGELEAANADMTLGSIKELKSLLLEEK